MSTKPVRVGGEVDSYCTKCKLLLNHRIVSMLDGKPAKVMCLTCDKPEVRLYRPHAPGQKPAVSSAGRSASGAAPRSARPSAAPKAEQIRADRERTWEKAIAGRAVADFKPYRVSSTFQEGDLLRHSRFGDGVVLRILDVHKIEVLFKEDSKTLAQGMAV